MDEESTDLDHNASLIIAQGYIVGSLLASNGPHTLQTIIQGALQAIRIGMPNADGSCSVA